ncbi:MAG TPA: hypothetical protein VIJ56_11195 [Acidimicrobiales bacterium]
MTTSSTLYSPNDWTDEDLRRFAQEIDSLVPVDLGIVRAVKILRDAGFAVTESCEGGDGHSYPEPTVQFVGSHATGWAAMAELMTYGLPIRRLGQMWTFDHSYGQGHPTGPDWFITFYRKLL